MKVLAYTDSDHPWRSNAIVEMSVRELQTFIGDDRDQYLPVIGIVCQPQKKLETANQIIRDATSAKNTASQLRSLAELIDTVAPGLDAIVNPRPTETTEVK